MRSWRRDQTIKPGSEQIEELRAEIGRLEAEYAAHTGSVLGLVTVGMTGRNEQASSQFVTLTCVPTM